MSIRPGVALLLTVCLASAGCAPAFAQSFSEPRPGDRDIDLVRRTNTLYGQDCFWGGPRGMEYAALPADEVRPIQIPNLYPDVQATYFVARFKLPRGARIALDGVFPHARYMSYALQTRVGDDYLAGDGLADVDIAPRPGSANPFDAGADRTAGHRDYRIEVVAGAPPPDRPSNVIHTGSDDPEAEVALVLRHYVPDAGRDGTGDAGLPALSVTLADGSRLTAAAACDALEAETTAPPPAGFPAALWMDLVGRSADPANMPAVDPPVWERFWNAQYSAIGKFLPPDQRARRYPPLDTGGFASNPHTRYLSTYASLNYGPVFVITGAMPRVPRTLDGVAVMPPGDLRYWSVCTGAAPASGAAYDCLFDEQVAVRAGRYTIVVSRPEDRPRNAREDCGVTWINFGGGEAVPGAAGPGRAHIAVIYMRFMQPDPGWPHAPHRVTEPGEEASVMGPYFPTGEYATTPAFEARGCEPI